MKQECKFFAGSACILKEETVMDFIKEKINEVNREEAFHVLDVGDIVQKIKVWKLKLPRVKPFYAVKCNDHPTVLELLAVLGIGFDCASKGEFKKILDLGVDASRIIFANPCKPASHLRQAAKFQIPLMTFDNETELHKIHAYYPEAKLVIRIRVDAADAQCNLGVKFGVFPEDAEPLLVAARDLGLNIVGVAFHVGSGCRDPPIFYKAIASARMIFDKAIGLGFNPYLLDIGGGFPGKKNTSLDKFNGIINNALDEFFPEDSGVEIIAEPGRYIVASAFTLATNIIAKREITDDNDTVQSIMYYINDGVYGSFNGILYENAKFFPIMNQKKGEVQYSCSIWGPTCDGIDHVVPNIKLPRMPCGEWIVWPEMGAYSIACSGNFNGFPIPEVMVVVPHHTWLYLEEFLGKKVLLTSLGDVNDEEQLDVQESPVLTTNAATHYTCGKDAMNPDILAQLTLCDVGEM